MIKFPRGADHCLAVEHASRLNPLDFAFVLRGDGTWTYGIVANKPVAADGLSIRFVLDGNGSTKTIRRKIWAKGIRPVNAEAFTAREEDEDDYPVSEEESGATPAGSC